MELLNKLKRFIAESYVMVRHPESISLRLSGINYEHFRELKRDWLLDLGIKTVLDVGANRGQFAKLARAVFPNSQIFSFEPLQECFAELKTCLPNDAKFTPMPFAIGRENSTREFFPSQHSPSSSFLQMTELHKEAFPESKEGQTAEPIMVEIRKLDALLASYELEPNILVKIDVQGFELDAIAGSLSILSKTNVVILEMSFAPIYDNQPLFHDVYSTMYNLGFRFRGNLAQMIHPKTGEVIQADAIFVRDNK